ncbi:MAG: hypothetical protein RI907_3120 [Pseudomonadota bacterium]
MAIDLHAHLDLYCERLGPEFWAEPLNAVSNAAFLVSAAWQWRLAKAAPGGVDWRSGVLIALVAAIGVGSFLFHTLGVYWAMLADVIPIFIYQLLFLVFYLQRVAGLPGPQVAAWVALFLAMSVGFGALPQAWLNGSLSYAPALIFVGGLGVYHHRRGKQASGALLGSALAFVLALTCRCLDMAVCEAFPWGTHHAWHTLNAVVLYASTLAFVRNRP